MTSANDHPSVVADYLANKLQAGWIPGPIPTDSIHISSFGARKQMASDPRFVTPLQASVNAGIPKNLCSLQYASIDDAANIVSELSQGTRLAKVDIAHAYRNIPVHPTCFCACSGRATSFPFGLQSAPKIFFAISDALEWILHTKGVSACLHFIDDFLTFGNPASHHCDNSLHILIKKCHELGLPLALVKIKGPAVILVFKLNTVLMTMRLPDNKLEGTHPQMAYSS